MRTKDDGSVSGVAGPLSPQPVNTTLVDAPPLAGCAVLDDQQRSKCPCFVSHLSYILSYNSLLVVPNIIYAYYMEINVPKTFTQSSLRRFLPALSPAV